MLWRKAIPTKKRMKEIEEGLKREFIETIQDPREILDLIPKLLSSSTEEIQLIVSKKETHQLFENEIKLTSLLREQLREGNHIQVLIHGEKNTEDYNPEDEFENLYQLQRDNPNQLETQLITSVVYDRLNVFISDRETLPSTILQISQAQLSSSNQNTILSAHNNERSAVGSPHLTWSNSLATEAQNYANQLASEGYVCNAQRWD